MSSEPPSRKPNPFAEQPITSQSKDGMDRSAMNSEQEPVLATLAGASDDSLQTLGRLHPISLAFDVITHVRSLIVPAVIAVYSAAKGSVGGLMLAGFIFIPTLIHSIIRYLSLRYRIEDSELIVTEGIFFQRNRTVPVSRIQNINLVQNVLHRILKVAEVRIETASGTEPEATLRVLSVVEVERLRNSIFHHRKQVQQATSSTDEKETEDSDNSMAAIGQDARPANLLLTIPWSQLARAGIASNKGSLLLGVLIGIYFQFDEQINSQFDLEKFIRSISEGASTATIVSVTTVAFLAIFLFFRLLGMGWYFLRFADYRLERSGEDFRISCGLFTKVSASVPRKRIQFISIHRNLFMRWMKLASIRIETAGGAGRGQEDATKTVSSRWFIPVLRESDVTRLIEELRPGLNWDEQAFDWQPISPKAAARLSRVGILTSILIAAAGTYLFWPWGWAIGLLAAPLLVMLAIKRSRSRKYARAGNVIVYRSGVFTKKTSMTFFEKIQTVSVDASPFDRRWDMATLCVDTAAAGPADHRLHIRYLTTEFAELEFDAIVQEAADQLPVFN